MVMSRQTDRQRHAAVRKGCRAAGCWLSSARLADDCIRSCWLVAAAASKKDAATSSPSSTTGQPSSLRKACRRDQPSEGQGSALRSLTISSRSCLPFCCLLFSLTWLSAAQAEAQARRLGAEERRVGAPTEGSTGGGRCGGRSGLQLRGLQLRSQFKLQSDPLPFQPPILNAHRSSHDSSR